MLAYITDPDGLDIEIIDQRPAAPAENGRPARPAHVPGVNHVGLIVLDSDKARAFYETLFGGKLSEREAPWMKGDFYDSVVGGHGNVLRFYNESFPEAADAGLAHEPGAGGVPEPQEGGREPQHHRHWRRLRRIRGAGTR